MSNEKLAEIFEKVSDSIEGEPGRWQFYVKDISLMCFTDLGNNRMRIISPIMETFQLSEELKNACLTANFHTALDVKYAISNDILWTVYIHPLKELSEEQLIDAISQVYASNITFGTSFSSSTLIFPGLSSEDSKEKKKTTKKERF
ncbi:MAG: hypothetical protein HKN54_06625 [Flavobacteriaceae bacterium]|nr:hypothetical protein [Flavobacteriaceae bacterium]